MVETGHDDSAGCGRPAIEITAATWRLSIALHIDAMSKEKKRSLGRAWLTMSCSDGLSGTQGARSNQVEKKNGESVKREIARCPGRFA